MLFFLRGKGSPDKKTIELFPSEQKVVYGGVSG